MPETKKTEQDLREEFFTAVLRDTVEGKPGPLSAEITDNETFIRTDLPINSDSKPRPEVIVALLRSSNPLSREMRTLIADLIDPEAETAFCFKVFGRRRPGRHPPWKTWHMKAALHVEERITGKGLYESAINSAMENFKLSRSQVAKSYSDLLEVRRIESELKSR